MITLKEQGHCLRIHSNNMVLNSIEVKNLKFKYDSQSEYYTVNDISFHVKQGEWISIVGHNGSGKSTVVRLIDGLLEAESGEIYVDSIRLTEDSVWDVRHKVGMVFQNPDNQFVGSTVEDDVAFGLENKGVPYEEMKYRIEEALKIVGMTEFKDREPARLSGGQKQRVAIAGAIAMRPQILILDEATSMLDPEGRLQLIQTLKDIRKQFQLTVVSITHDLDEISLSDRVIVMKKGKIETNLTPRDLFSDTHKLKSYGLDLPFTSKLIESFSKIGFDFSLPYLTEKELREELCQLISTK